MMVFDRITNLALRPVRKRIVALIERAAVAQRVEVNAKLAAADSAIDELRSRVFALERLVTGTVAARPPGAMSAVAELDDPAVAIIMPTHDRPRYLPEAIASVRAQSFQKWELVVIGDGSDKSTEAAVAPFLADPRIRFVWQENAGGANARNLGIAESKAPIVAYLDDDNLWYPDFLARAVDCLATSPEVDVLYGALVTYTHLDRGCVLWRAFSREELLRDNFIDTSVIVHRRSMVDRFGGWDQSVARLCDWDLMLRYTQEKPALALDVLAAYYRVCDDQRTSTRISNVSAKEEILGRLARSAQTPVR